MNIRAILFIALTAFSLSAAAQSIIKPSIMIVPDSAWCAEKGYTTADGTIDYSQALLDNNYLDVTNELEGIMASRYEVENLSAKLNYIRNMEAVILAYASNDGKGLRMEALDWLSLNASADIIVSVAVNKRKHGPMINYVMTFRAIDTATLRVLHSDELTGQGRTSGTGLKTILAHGGVLDNFCIKLQQLFDEQLVKGRECRFEFGIANDCTLNFFSVVNHNGSDITLGSLINKWLSDNAISTNFHTEKASDNQLSFSHVMIPLMGKSGFSSRKAIDAQSFIANITPHLKQYGLTADVIPLGIGKALIKIKNKY